MGRENPLLAFFSKDTRASFGLHWRELEIGFGGGRVRNQMPNKRILVVDDEAMVLDAVRMTLTHYGYSVETASSGAEALEKLLSTNFDLIVTDLKMPGMTGDQLAREVKKRQPDMPVILLTGYPPERQPAEVDAILLKPFSTTDLRATVTALMSKGE
jgi:CheY-like chemotaxis protein